MPDTSTTPDCGTPPATVIGNVPATADVTVFVTTTFAYALGRASWSLYTTEKVKWVAVVPLAGTGATVPVHRAVGCPGLTHGAAAATGLAELATVRETASSSAASVATMARITFVQRSPQRGGPNLDRLGRAVGDLTVPVGPDPFGRPGESRRHHQRRHTTPCAGA
jgi:hypothetical protein